MIILNLKFSKMMKTKKIQPTAIILGITLSLLSTNSYAQEAAHKDHQSHRAFVDKEAVAKMSKNFESPERDAMQKPEDVLLYMGNLKGKKIIDIGAATGYFSVKFAANGADVIAADVSEGFQKYLKERVEKEDSMNIELRKIPYDNPLLRDNEVDIAFIANTYHHIQNRTKYFSKVKKGLKENGELIIVDFFKAEFTETVQAPAMTMRASVDEIVFELKKAGFTSFEVEVNLLPYQYIIKAK